MVSSGRRFYRPHLAFSASWKKRASASSGEPQDTTERFRLVMLPHLDAAFSLARYLSRDPDAAEEIVQNAFLRAFRSFEGFRGDAAKAWLFAIVRNCCMDWLNANRDRQRLFDSELPIEQRGDAIEHETPESILARSGNVALVRSTIDNLPEPFRETLILRELEGFSYREISMIIQVPIGTVMSRLARARQMLCDLLIPADGGVRSVQS